MDEKIQKHDDDDDNDDADDHEDEEDNESSFIHLASVLPRYGILLTELMIID